MPSADTDFASRFSEWSARQEPEAQRIRRFYTQLFGTENPHMSTTKPADDVTMPGDLPYPERATATTIPWVGVRGTADEGSILQEAERLVHGPRQEAYGHPANDFSRTAALLNIVLAGKLRDELDAADVALMMVCVKLSREVNKHGRDNLVDAAGYLETRRMVLDYFHKLQG